MLDVLEMWWRQYGNWETGERTEASPYLQPSLKLISHSSNLLGKDQLFVNSTPKGVNRRSMDTIVLFLMSKYDDILW